jgi:IS5 family transposase
MRGQPGFFDIDDRLKRLSDLGDQLETFRSAVDFEVFRPELNAALSYTERPEGGRPPFDPVLMFKILAIQATNNLSSWLPKTFSRAIPLHPKRISSPGGPPSQL